MKSFFARLLLFCCSLLFIGNYSVSAQTGSFYDPFDAGTFSSCSRNFIHTADNTGMYHQMGQVSGDLFYRFVVSGTVTLEMSHCNSMLSDTYMTLFDEWANPIISNDDYGPVCYARTSSISITLTDGVYYLLSEGYSSYSGLITTEISSLGGQGVAGDSRYNPIQAGQLSPGVDFVDTRSNDGCFYHTIGQGSPEIYYSFQITQPRTVNISLCGSLIDTYLHLLDANGVILESNDDNGPLCSGLQSSITRDLNAGTYYVVSEGYSGNMGLITTRISVNAPPVTRCAVEGTQGVVQNPILSTLSGSQLDNNAVLTLPPYVPAEEA
jgi:hypothetical protein